LIPDDGGRLPFALSLSGTETFSFNLLSVAPGDPVKTVGSEIRVNGGELIVDLAHLSVDDDWQLQHSIFLTPASAMLDAALDMLVTHPATQSSSRILGRTLTGLFNSAIEPENDGDPFHSKIMKILHRFIRAVRNGAINTAGTELTSLVGLGWGLTPSGDDIITGILSAWHFDRSAGRQAFEKKAIIQRLKTAYRGRTTRVAEEYLFHALAGRFSDRVRDFTLTLAAGEADQVIDSGSSLFRFGASSGTDTGLGILIGLKLLSEYSRP
ncbi:MAG: DUF2877 domain-containing protein, partial [Desulfocapsaceae bacterium]